MRSLQEKISRRVRQLIDEKKTTQEAVALSAGRSKNYISELINQKKRWNVDLIEEVSKALDVPQWQLLIDPREVIPPEYIRLMDDYKRLDPMRRQIVDDTLAAAKKEEIGGEKKSNGSNGHT